MLGTTHGMTQPGIVGGVVKWWNPSKHSQNSAVLFSFTALCKFRETLKQAVLVMYKLIKPVAI